MTAFASGRSTRVATREATLAPGRSALTPGRSALTPGRAPLPLIVSLADRDWPPVEEASIECRNGIVETLIAHELDEAESATPSSLSIKHDTCAPDLMASVFEMGLQRLIGAAK